MSGDLRNGGQGGESALADELLANPGFLVTADPEQVVALLDLALGPAGRLAAAVYRASARVHRDADVAARRQILAVDAARYGDQDLSDRIAAVEIPDVPAVRWRVDWATGSQAHPGFRGFLDDSNGDWWPPPVVAVDGRPATITRADDILLARDLATGKEVAQTPLTSSVRGQETTVVVDGRPVKVSCAGPDSLPRILDACTGELLGVLPTSGKSGRAMYYVESVTIDGRPCIIAIDEKSMAVWDLATRELIGELESDGDDLQSWAFVTLDGRPHMVTGSFYGKVEVWDLSTCERISACQGDDRELQLMVAATINGRPHVLTRGCNPYVGTPLDTVSVWSVDPLQQVDRLPFGAEKVETTTLGDRSYAVIGARQVWELSRAAPVGNRTPGHSATVTAVTTTVIDGQPVAVTGSYDETLRLWDLATGRPVGPPLSTDTDEYDGVTQVRTKLVDGHPYAVTGHEDGYHEGDAPVWDLAAGTELADYARPAEITESMIDEGQLVPALMSLSVGGHTFALTYSSSSPYAEPSFRFRDLDTGQEIEATLLGPTGEVTAYATGMVNGRSVVVVAAFRHVRVWDFTGETAAVTDELVFPDRVDAVAVTPEGRLVVGFGNDIAVLSHR